jgi:Holliday junction DNA helicase RuvB
VANRLLKRVRDYADVRAGGVITKNVAIDALSLEGIDGHGLGETDRKFLKTIILNYKGGPVGIEALAATLQLESDVLIEVVEPFLLKSGSSSAPPRAGRPRRGPFPIWAFPDGDAGHGWAVRRCAAGKGK